MIDHVGVTVSNLDRALEFWTERLGLRLLGRVVERGGDLADLVGVDEVEVEIADLQTADGRIVELLHYRTPAGTPVQPATGDPGGVHVALRVDDLEAALARLDGSEARVLSRRPVTLHDPGGIWDGAVCCYIEAPDGVVVELVERPGVRRRTSGPGPNNRGQAP